MSGNGNGCAHHVHKVPSILDAALYYALTLKLLIFPCRCADKKPFTQHGFHDASRDEAQVRAWFGAQFPDAMIGIPTGSASRVMGGRRRYRSDKKDQWLSAMASADRRSTGKSHRH